MSTLDRTSLAGGVALLIVGTVLMLDATGVIDLTFALLWPMFAAAVGAILLVAGADDRRRGR